jgi:hypothetical protein
MLSHAVSPIFPLQLFTLVDVIPVSLEGLTPLETKLVNNEPIRIPMEMMFRLSAVVLLSGLAYDRSVRPRAHEDMHPDQTFGLDLTKVARLLKRALGEDFRAMPFGAARWQPVLRPVLVLSSNVSIRHPETPVDLGATLRDAIRLFEGRSADSAWDLRELWNQTRHMLRLLNTLSETTIEDLRL